MVRETKFAVAVAIYLKGEELNPARVSDFLGLAPTRASRKGDQTRSSDGQVSLVKTGLWSVRICRDDDSPTISEMITELKSKFRDQAANVKSAPGVDNAYLDIFIAEEVAPSVGGNCEFLLTAQDVLNLASFNVPLSVTFTVAAP